MNMFSYHLIYQGKNKKEKNGKNNAKIINSHYTQLRVKIFLISKK